MTDYLLFDPLELKSFMAAFFEKLGVPKEDAEVSADILLEADLRGVDSHGTIRLNTYYGSRLKNGLINPLSPITVLRESPVALALDGGNGLGMAVAYRAMKRCIEKAKESGVAVTTVRNSNHYGIAGYYAMMALEGNLIGVSLTNSQPLVVPTYGRQALLGTNPIAVAVPAGDERPFVLDMATSIVTIGRVTVYKSAGKEIPAGWAVDSSGLVTTSPEKVVGGGALLPLGGTDEMRGYKGYGLSLLVDIFSGILSGGGYGPKIGRPMQPGDPTNVGHFFAAFRIDAFRPLQEFLKDMDTYIRLIKDSEKAEGQDRIFIHGEKEFELAEQRKKTGVPIMENTVNSLKEAAKEVGLDSIPAPIGKTSME